MESKLNREALTQFSRSFGTKVCDEFFIENGVVKGADILSISEVQQINLFVISKINIEWTKDVQHFKSPYFNYEHAEVKKALSSFMNTVSKHIEIKRDVFEPLLQEATHETILLLFSPYDFYNEWVNREDHLNIEDLKAFSKYTKINKGLYQSYIEILEQGGKSTYSSEEASSLLNKLFENTDILPEDFESYEQQFASVMKLPVGAFYGSEEEPVLAQEPLQKEEPVKEVKVLINEETKSEKKILNDQLAKEKKTLLDDIGSKKIDSIKSYLSINQKFIFINQLFDGKSNDFNSVIEFLDDCGSQAEAMDFINNNYLKKNHWKKDAQEVKDFIEVVARKYA